MMHLWAQILYPWLCTHFNVNHAQTSDSFAFERHRGKRIYQWIALLVVELDKLCNYTYLH